jgi:hypothetical protein
MIRREFDSWSAAKRTALLFVLDHLGGVLTIVRPCVLPVLPFVFARADRPFTRSTLPMLVGMAAIFGAVEDKKHCYTTGAPRLNEWGLAGEWTIAKEHARLSAANGTVVYRFHARDLHLVFGPGVDGNGSIPPDLRRNRAGQRSRSRYHCRRRRCYS